MKQQIMLPEDASTHQRGKDIIEKDEIASKTHLIGIKGPKLITVRGAPKGKK